VGEPLKAGKKIVHAVLGAGSSAFMLGGTGADGTHASPRELGLVKQAFGLFVYVADVDAHFKQVRRYKDLAPTAPQTRFWGDRTYDVVDRDGHRWTFASRVAILTPEQMTENLKALPA
jgi:PhnB protein